MTLETPIGQVRLIGPAYSKKLAKLEIRTVRDLLYHFPSRYQDYSLISLISQAQPGETVTIKGRMIELKNRYTKWGKKIQTGSLQDKSGSIDLIWFNQPFLTSTLKRGVAVNLSGKIEIKQNKKTLISPEYELNNGKQPIHTGGLIPIYSETYKISSKWLRSRVNYLLNLLEDEILDELPVDLLRKYKLLDLKTSLNKIHFPFNIKEAEESRKRFAFEELFLLQLKNLERKKQWKNKKTIHKLKIFDKEIKEFVKKLDFKLTDDQQQAINEILKDLTKTIPMNRLLEGDVGSGKTIVAAIVAFNALLNKTQVALMVPTEILAKQHFETFSNLFKTTQFKIALLTGRQKKTITDFDIAIGTHRLIYQQAHFKNLSLAIIDEQHRFGVEQRAKLGEKGRSPHILTMTATPIPRTVALSLYNNLDLSFLKEKPIGRKIIKTWVVPNQKRQNAYDWIAKQIKKNQQVFIVCPLIDESETLVSLKSAKKEFDHLKDKIFPQFKLGLVHGKLKENDRDEIIKKFHQQKIDILVSTPVVEVGIDIPNAAVMLIESADRFGLAQLHQLRGRVGRNNQQAYCLLFSDNQNENSLNRLKALEKLNEGDQLAELDLKLRGPGEIFGSKQHGRFQLKVADFSDLPLIKLTLQSAKDIYPKLDKYPALQARVKKDTITSIDPN